MDKLKPCPFCGHDARLKDYTDREYGFDDYRIECTNCSCKMTSPNTHEQHYWMGKMSTPQTPRQMAWAKQKLIEAWNTRASAD